MANPLSPNSPISFDLDYVNTSLIQRLNEVHVAIAPGMVVSAEIITGDRRVIEYALSPVLRCRHEAGRER